MCSLVAKSGVKEAQAQADAIDMSIDGHRGQSQAKEQDAGGGLRADPTDPNRLDGSDAQLAAKRLELLRETAGELAGVAVLWNPTHPVTPASFREVQSAASTLQLRLLSLEVRDPAGVASAFRTADRAGVGALLVLRDPFTVRQMAQIAELATQGRLPAMYETRDFVDAGGLMLYGPSLADLYRRAASYIDKILKGTKPADLPVEQPTKFDFVINLKTARALGLTIPQSVLLQATELIQ